MAYQYGMRKAKLAIIYLASAENIQSRIERAWEEIMGLSEIHMPPDTAIELFERRQIIYQSYQTLSRNGRPAEVEDLDKIARDLAELCADIIELNSKDVEEQEPLI
ncbi:MAG: hypothetical protein C5B59_13515 [Bacteroidetes bacterium]|nr:MAG: hypothetical protein C5B59_13515 [Bacteroidota bacterium]